jgi:hypothetical protein
MPLPRPQPVLVKGKGKAAEALRTEIDASPLLLVANQAEIGVEVQDGRFVFLLGERPLGAVRFSGFRPDRKARDTLEHLAGYLNVLNLATPNNRLGLEIDVELKRLSQAATKDKPAQTEPLSVENEAVLLANGRNLAIDVTNRSQVPLYIYVLDLDEEIRLAPLHPASGYGKPAKPGEVISIGYGPDVVITFTTLKGQKESIDDLLIFGSVNPIDPAPLTLPALGEKRLVVNDLFGTGSRLDRDLRTALTGQVPDAATALDPQDSWILLRRAVLVRR